MTYAEQIKAARDRAGLSQAQAADALGVDRITFWRWEHDRCAPVNERVRDMYVETLEEKAEKNEKNP